MNSWKSQEAKWLPVGRWRDCIQLLPSCETEYPATESDRKSNLRPTGMAFGFSSAPVQCPSGVRVLASPAVDRPWGYPPGVSHSQSLLPMAVSNRDHSWTGKEMIPQVARLTLSLPDHLSFSQAEAWGISITGGHRTRSEPGYSICKSRGTNVFPVQPVWPFKGLI